MLQALSPYVRLTEAPGIPLYVVERTNSSKPRLEIDA